jgi:hypothetical protein
MSIETTDAPVTEAKQDDKAIHKEALEEFRLCQAAEKDNREEALKDLKFARLGDQWPEEVRRKREAQGRPCMTFNRMPTFIRAVVNEGRQNKPAIKVHPADDQADPPTAEVINGLIRNIEYSSNADVAYDTGLDFAASCGIGYWRVGMEYSHDDTFDMDLEIQRCANPFAVYGDYESTEADSSDWNRAFVVDKMPRDVFEKKYKGAEKVDWESDTYSKMPEEWSEGKNIMVAEYWRRREVPRTVVLLSDGQVVGEDWLAEEVPDMPGVTNQQIIDQAGVTEVDRRTTRSYKVTQYIMNGVEILETNEWPGKYIPLVPVYGEELNIEGKRHYRSLIRDAKDPQLNFNYWRTTSTENLGLTTKAPWVGKTGSFDTDRDKWEQANTEPYAFLEYDGEVAPTRLGFSGPDAGALQEAMNASDDMKATIGIFDASLGARSNETSGIAINARKQQASNSTFHFIDNQARAIRHTGRILIDLIPHVYNKARIVRVMGEDKKPQNVPVNQPLNGQAGQGEDGTAQVYDLTLGKYDLTVDTGPGFQTKREEAAYGMTELMRALPASAPVIGPHLAKAQDWPGADEIGEQLAALAPGGAQNNPAVQQAQQQIQQLSQELQQCQEQLRGEQADKSLEAQKLQIELFNAQTTRMKTEAELAKGGDMPQDPGALSEADKILLEARVKEHLQAQTIDGNIQLELVRQQGAAAAQAGEGGESDDQGVEKVDPMQQLMEQMALVQKMIAAPRRRTLVRGPDGRALGATDEIDMPADDPAPSDANPGEGTDE